MPWSNFFRKMALCDTFVLLDDVQYEKNGYTNRVKIRTEKGLEWITIPVKHKHDTIIRDVTIDYDSGKYWKPLNKIVENYLEAKNFQRLERGIARIFDEHPEYLWSLNTEFICLFKEILKLPCDIVSSSDLDIKTKGSDRILDICRLLNADRYITGTSANKYLKLEDFRNNDIDVVYMNPLTIHKPYKQCFEPFISGASELDFIMCADY